MHDAADFGEGFVERDVGVDVGRRLQRAFDDLAVEVDDHHIGGGHALVGHAARFDHDQAALAAYATSADPFELRADLGRLEGCLGGLEPARRDCILYAYVEGCSHGEIAERLQTPLGTVKAWIQRGMRALRECMA